MADSVVVLITLIVYKIILLSIGFWASSRNHSTTDFFLGGRQLGSWVAAISASASSSSAWTLLGVSGAAYLWGLSAIWLFPSVLCGFLVNWLWIAPKVRRLSEREDAITLTDLMITEPESPLTSTIKRTATLIIVFCFTFYIAAQFKAAGSSFTSIFGLSFNQAIWLGAIIIMTYTLVGGFWAVSITDTLQGLMMAVAAVALPIAAIVSIGGLDQLFTHYSEFSGSLTSWTGTHQSIAALGFVFGTMGIGAGYPGQPHVINRFMALKDESSMQQAKFIAIGWAVLVYSGMLLLGWSARILLPQIGDGETVFFATTQLLFNPVFSGIIIAAVLSAVMSTADSQILVVSSSIVHDNRHSHRTTHQPMLQSRLAVIGVCVAAVLLALWVDDTIFNRVLFAWHAVGSAFGPVLIVRLLGRQLSSALVLASMLTGFALTLIINSQPDLPGDFAERWVPFLAALSIGLFNSHKKNSQNQPGSRFES